MEHANDEIVPFISGRDQALVPIPRHSDPILPARPSHLPIIPPNILARYQENQKARNISENHQIQKNFISERKVSKFSLSKSLKSTWHVIKYSLLIGIFLTLIIYAYNYSDPGIGNRGFFDIFLGTLQPIVQEGVNLIIFRIMLHPGFYCSVLGLILAFLLYKAYIVYKARSEIKRQNRARKEEQKKFIADYRYAQAQARAQSLYRTQNPSIYPEPFSVSTYTLPRAILRNRPQGVGVGPRPPLPVNTPQRESFYGSQPGLNFNQTIPIIEEVPTPSTTNLLKSQPIISSSSTIKVNPKSPNIVSHSRSVPYGLRDLEPKPLIKSRADSPIMVPPLKIQSLTHSLVYSDESNSNTSSTLTGEKSVYLEGGLIYRTDSKIKLDQEIEDSRSHIERKSIKFSESYDTFV